MKDFNILEPTINSKLMKKLILLLLGFALGAVLTYFFCCKQSETGMENLTPPKGLITPQEAKALDTAYNPRYQLISDSIVTRRGGDNRSSWYSLGDMRAYLDYAENEADSLGFTMNGIRVYLGAYPDTNGIPGYTTMFFVPTGYLKSATNTSDGSLNAFSHFMQGGKGDITGGSGFNEGGNGHPPGANYPQ